MSEYKIFRTNDGTNFKMEYIAELSCLEAGMFLWTWTEDCNIATIFHSKIEVTTAQELMGGLIMLVTPPSETPYEYWWQKYESYN